MPNTIERPTRPVIPEIPMHQPVRLPSYERPVPMPRERPVPMPRERPVPGPYVPPVRK